MKPGSTVESTNYTKGVNNILTSQNEHSAVHLGGIWHFHIIHIITYGIWNEVRSEMGEMRKIMCKWQKRIQFSHFWCLIVSYHLPCENKFHMWKMLRISPLVIFPFTLFSTFHPSLTYSLSHVNDMKMSTHKKLPSMPG